MPKHLISEKEATVIYIAWCIIAMDKHLFWSRDAVTRIAVTVGSNSHTRYSADLLIHQAEAIRLEVADDLGIPPWIE